VFHKFQAQTFVESERLPFLALDPGFRVLSYIGETVANAADDPIPTTVPYQCQGEHRGAVLRDNGTPLVGIDYPTLNRSSDLPGTGGLAVVSSTMGTYTVYVRQDTRDCRMGNFTCDLAPTSGPDGGVGGGGSLSDCTTAPVVPPNGVVIVRSEGWPRMAGPVSCWK